MKKSKFDIPKDSKSIRKVQTELKKGIVSREARELILAITKAASRLRKTDAYKLIQLQESTDDKEKVELLEYFVGKWTSLKKFQQLVIRLQEDSVTSEDVKNILKASFYSLLKEERFQKNLSEVYFFMSNKYVIHTLADRLYSEIRPILEEKKLKNPLYSQHGYIEKDKKLYMFPSEASKRLFDKGIYVNKDKAISQNTLRNYANEGLVPVIWYKDLMGTYYTDKVGRKKNFRLFPDLPKFYKAVGRTILSKQCIMRLGKKS